MIVRSKTPKVLEFPFAELDSYITPNEHFYVRHHFPEPEMHRDSWRLIVDGCVETPLQISYEELLAMPARTVVSTLECAGNNRIFLEPPVNGVQWHLGGTSTSAWKGVPLAEVLKRAGVKPEAVDVVLEGADKGEVELEPKPDGPIHFARSLPMNKALDPDVLLCYRMNGEDLSIEHGFPVRVVVPGWYAMASVKWLTQITVIDRPFDGYFQTADYAFNEQKDGKSVRVPISQMLVKAQISHPRPDEVVPANTAYRVKGAGWCGESTLEKIEISTDGGTTWDAAHLVGTPVRNAWCFFEYAWHTPTTPGPIVLMARATDDKGNTQTMEHKQHHGTYMINHCLPISVIVQ